MDGAPFTATLNGELRAFMERRFPLVASRGLDDDAALLDSGAIDSLGLLDVVAFLEDEMGVEIDDDDMTPENFASINELARFVERKRA